MFDVHTHMNKYHLPNAIWARFVREVQSIYEFFGSDKSSRYHSVCLSVCPSVHSAQSSLEHLFFLVLAQSERKRVIRLRHTVGA